ncbi:MAG: AbrB/MazE/SpoVT family DNA-binding domain-containing protein [Firmicutes bacterium]|nr:AbrB/MazE/SpoVT family DNA-binding domain-containing protein [Bacillota bacterium]
MKTYRILGKRGRITVPYEIRCKVGFKQNDVLSFEESADGRTVVIKREIICDCNGEKSKEKKDKQDEITLYDFLNGLSPEQQRAALIHLSVKWAQNQAGGKTYEQS